MLKVMSCLAAGTADIPREKSSREVAMNVFRMNWVLTPVPGCLPNIGCLETKKGFVFLFDVFKFRAIPRNAWSLSNIGK